MNCSGISGTGSGVFRTPFAAVGVAAAFFSSGEVRPWAGCRSGAAKQTSINSSSLCPASNQSEAGGQEHGTATSSAVRSSAKPSRAANDNSNLINRTIGLWQSRCGRSLSREDARQIVENVSGFFLILHEWSRAETLSAANDNRERSVVHGTCEVRHDR
jgi:hypothetical protein